jgi:predicted DNA-binding transcriptional regulator AlpA
MTDNTGPGSPGHCDPRHLFLTSKEVIARFGWGRTYGYQMLNSTGFPKPIGGRYRPTLWPRRLVAARGAQGGPPDGASP